MARDFTQSSEQFLLSIDREIERLQTMRAQVAAALGGELAAKPAGSTRRQGMSEEGRRRIAEAQKARWSKQKSAAKAPAKKAAGQKTASKKAPAKRTAKQAGAKTAKTAEQA